MEIKQICKDGNCVGKVWVTSEGMYWLVKCFCDIAIENVYAVTAKENGNTKELGICVPRRNGPSIVARVPKREINMTSASFYLSCKETAGKNEIFSLDPDMPLCCISQLDRAFLQIGVGGACLRVQSN